MPRYDLPNAAPDPLRLVQLFVNTSDEEHGLEWLASPGDLAEWLREHGLPTRRVDAGELERALALRGALRMLMRVNNGATVDREAIAVVNASGVSVRLDDTARVRLDAGEAVLGRVLEVAFAAMLDGSWVRLKACRQCSFAFYDYSKNRSATWCSMQICGNRLKTRAYRQRKRSA